mmetsp:Transcript_8571/g.20842  ORF Transcript_8571/g.20842 Transcript_8571/m.20842 type:complete len:336 (+) Transcript_8571:471-1478(+)|eukprot:CAMPEP_0178993314 /NCGR_PEP_ID=MMETSP0795-20121207/6636_1 /TAXON_ID=88552 /ORGANISM="Amoebophrya sp., Strain Ameob2" /LENGTH=335 /DNA_ID=CAMNT_0020685363 /DNA_START=401 /DNA_END=1408 /DNA_ORIENTATION=-
MYGSTDPSLVTAQHRAAAYNKPLTLDYYSQFLILLLPLGVFYACVYFLAGRFYHELPHIADVLIAWFLFFYFFHLAFVLYKFKLGRLFFKKWHVLFQVGLASGLFGGIFTGKLVYETYGHKWYSYQDLADYVLIDPANARGQSYMDSGALYFKQGTRVATESATVFQDTKLYCVAPIIGQPLEGNLPPSATFDFWAVGTDCCKPDGASFKCGEVDNNLAKAGMRVINSEEVAFYRLAVEQWSNEFGLPSRHPLFFTWVQDPVSQVDGLYSQLSALSWNACGLYLVVYALFFAIVVYFCPGNGDGELDVGDGRAAVDWKTQNELNQKEIWRNVAED